MTQGVSRVLIMWISEIPPFTKTLSYRMVPCWGIARTTLNSSSTLYHLTNLESSLFNQFWQLNYFLKSRIAKHLRMRQAPNGGLKNKSQCIIGCLPFTKILPVDGKERWSTSEPWATHCWGREGSGLGLPANVTSSICPTSRWGSSVWFSGVQNWGKWDSEACLIRPVTQLDHPSQSQ